MQTERLRNRGTCDVGVKNRRLVAELVHSDRHHGRHGRLADAALAGNDGNDMLDVGKLVGRSQKALRAAAGAAFAAAVAVAAARCTHKKNLLFCFILTPGWGKVKFFGSGKGLPEGSFGNWTRGPGTRG